MILICVHATKATTTQCLFESHFELRINKSIYNWIYQATGERQVNTCYIKFLRNIKSKMACLSLPGHAIYQSVPDYECGCETNGDGQSHFDINFSPAIWQGDSDI